jgi:MOSC domain-containing protein YiiM
MMTLTHIYLSPEHNYFGHHGRPAGQAPVIEVGEAEAVEGKGLRGDRFFGWKEDYKGQVTFFSEEVYQQLRVELGEREKSVSVFRRNLIVQGVDLMALVGKEFELQGVRFLGMEEARPCYWMDQAFAPGAEEALKGRAGLRAKVLSTGTLRTDFQP